MQHHFLDNYCDLRREQHQDLEVVFRVGIEFVALQIEHADNFIVGNNRRNHFRTSPRPGVDVTRLVAYVRRDVWLAAQGDVPDQTLAHLQAQLL